MGAMQPHSPLPNVLKVLAVLLFVACMTPGQPSETVTGMMGQGVGMGMMQMMGEGMMGPGMMR